MTFELDSKRYMEYIARAAKVIAQNGDYVTSLDAIVGDGDHWVNLNNGFTLLLENSEKLTAADISGCFKQIGMLMMSGVGGSSGVLYGSAYLSAAKAAAGKNSVGYEELCACLESMLEAMMQRGMSKPGYKTMIDALYPAVNAYKKAIADKTDEKQTFCLVKKAAEDGAESTRAMEAVRGRACYRPDKGVGQIDPGAVTMAYQIAALCDYITEECLS